MSDPMGYANKEAGHVHSGANTPFSEAAMTQAKANSKAEYVAREVANRTHNIAEHELRREFAVGIAKLNEQVRMLGLSYNRQQHVEKALNHVLHVACAEVPDRIVVAIAKEVATHV
jgi:hypothetical protein